MSPAAFASSPIDQSFEGGAIYDKGTIIGPITAWSFTSNVAYDNGGAIYNDSASPITLSSSTFTSNNADTDGGAIYNIGAGGLILNDGTLAAKVGNNFTSNTARGIGGHGGGSGGAIYNTSTLTATAASSASGTAFTTNSALREGGAIWNSGNVNVNFVTITGTNGTGFDASSGGGVYIAGGTATMSNITFSDNNAGGNLFGTGDGGGLFVASGNVTLSKATFTGNTAFDIGSKGQNGAGIFVNGGSVTINNASTFTDNQSTNGGAIYVNGGTLAVQSATFTSNSASKFGGAVFVASAGSASITTSTFNSNSAIDGSALFDQGNLTATAISLIANSATSGGGIYNMGSGTLLNSTLTNNKATNGGGAYNATGALEFVNATLAFNAASTAGGGIFNAAALSLLNTIVAENSAPLGPDIYNAAAPTSSTTNNFVNNVYEDLLGRPADAGASFWVGLLNSGTPASTVVLGIEGSQEYRIDLVNKLYVQYLKRVADPGGLMAWTGMLANGGTIEQVIDGLVSSPEYIALNGGTPSGFVAGLYQDILGRTGSAMEVQGWVNALAAGATPVQVASLFLTSPEYRTNLVQSYFITYLGRPTDSGGLAAFLGQLNAGVRDQVVLAEILGSPEGVGNQSLSAGYATLANNLIGNNSGSGISPTQGNGNLVGTATTPLNPKFASNTPASVNGSPPVLSLTKASPAVDAGSDSVLGRAFQPDHRRNRGRTTSGLPRRHRRGGIAVCLEYHRQHFVRLRHYHYQCPGIAPFQRPASPDHALLGSPGDQGTGNHGPMAGQSDPFPYHHPTGGSRRRHRPDYLEHHSLRPH